MNEPRSRRGNEAEIERSWKSASLRSAATGFNGPNAFQKEMEALHEPENVRVDFQWLTHFRFMVPMRAKVGLEALP